MDFASSEKHYCYACQLMRGHDVHKDYARDDALMFHALIDKEQQSTTVELGI